GVEPWQRRLLLPRAALAAATPCRASAAGLPRGNARRAPPRRPAPSPPPPAGQRNPPLRPARRQAHASRPPGHWAWPGAGLRQRLAAVPRPRRRRGRRRPSRAPARPPLPTAATDGAGPARGPRWQDLWLAR